MDLGTAVCRLSLDRHLRPGVRFSSDAFRVGPVSCECRLYKGFSWNFGDSGDLVWPDPIERIKFCFFRLGSVIGVEKLAKSLTLGVRPGLCGHGSTCACVKPQR